MPRFEIVSEPVEERLHKGIVNQVEATLVTAHGVLEGLKYRTNNVVNATSTAFSDKRFVHTLSTTAVGLLSPASLPGFLLTIALLLRLAHVLIVHKLAKRAVLRQYKVD